MKEFIDSLYCIVYNLSVISKDEFMLFATFVNESIDEIVYGINEIIELVKDFRTLNTNQQNELIDCIHTYCNPINFSGNKIDMRDFHNWLNETQQIWYHLPFTGKFMVENYILRTI